ncbi:MAG: hypothetical protein PHP44_00200 [Kiritimatiellae bacterium]|nr:hypothetical protein [Kiritimatiellia bacterium]
MVALGFMFESGPVFLGICILALPFVGVAFSVSDYRSERRHARIKGRPLPSRRILIRSLLMNPYMGFFIGIIGFITAIIGSLSFFHVKEITILIILKAAACLIIGIALMIAGKFVMRTSFR